MEGRREGEGEEREKPTHPSRWLILLQSLHTEPHKPFQGINASLLRVGRYLKLQFRNEQTGRVSLDNQPVEILERNSNNLHSHQ